VGSPIRYLATETRDIGVIRRSLGAALGDAGLDPDASGEVLVMTSELVANALTHASSPAEVVVELANRRVQVTVSDEVHSPPVLRPAAPTQAGGNGMRIIDALSDEWGTITHAGDGKAVWFTRRW
jgi:anti-sigma regulatory factor (Ser/Thr protein kinase)